MRYIFGTIKSVKLFYSGCKGILQLGGHSPLQPQIEQSVVNDIAVRLSVNKFFVNKYIKSRLHATWAGKVIPFDKLIALRLLNLAFFGNSLQQINLI